MFYILLNMLLAIVMEAYSRVGENTDKSKGTPPVTLDYFTLAHFVYRRYIGCSKLNTGVFASKKFYGELASEIEKKCLESIRDAYVGAEVGELHKKYVRYDLHAAGTNFRQKQDENKVECLLAACQVCDTIVAVDEDKNLYGHPMTLHHAKLVVHWHLSSGCDIIPLVKKSSSKRLLKNGSVWPHKPVQVRAKAAARGAGAADRAGPAQAAPCPPARHSAGGAR